MSVSSRSPVEAALSSILADHFENSGNPHETIYRMWLLLNLEQSRDGCDIDLLHIEARGNG